ncbi:MAG: hypothetical protein JXD19_07170 [Deltaproteobacteria bacterium]|nr:hypothetical protein [Deltaproteobacteria bacterium]
MGKTARPDEIFAEFTENYTNIYGNDLAAIILYGSGAGGDYQPGKSDLNFLIVLAESVIDRLDRALTIVSKWRKRGVSVPLFMTKAYIQSSLDSFPLEFLTMKHQYVLVSGEDVLANLALEPHHVRLQCEREIKGKLILLREGFLGTEGNEKRIKALIASSITAFISIFHGILFLKNRGIPTTRREIVRAVADELAFDSGVFTECLDVKEGGKKFSSTEINDLFIRYVTEVRKLWELVDTMETKNEEV